MMRMLPLIIGAGLADMSALYTPIEATPGIAGGPPGSRKYRDRSKYSGADLRTIRATGQARECQRRRCRAEGK